MASIQESSDYGRFTWHNVNRDTRIKKMVASMKTHGWIDAYPAHAVRVNGKIKIKAGHHRCEAAKTLGLPIKYVLCDDAADIFELEQATNPWSVRDFIVGNARSGKSAYAEVLEYHERTGINITLSIGLHCGSVSGGNVYVELAKRGEFHISNTSLPAKVEHMVTHMKRCCVQNPTANTIVSAIATIVQVDGLDISRLKAKIKISPDMVFKCAGMSETFRMFEDVYNRRATHSERVPLAFLCEEFTRNNKNWRAKRKTDASRQTILAA
jgi:hypothetical protein